MSDKLNRITGDASIKRYYDTDYIGAYSIDDGVEPVLTIDSLWYGDLTLGGGRKEPHVVMKFREKTVPGVEEVKPLILNATNRKTLKKLFGGDSAAVLEGKRIQLYVDPKVRDPQDGGFTEGLRIKPFVPRSTETGPVKCEDCGNEITAAGKMNAAQIVAFSRKRFGMELCAGCMKVRDAVIKAAEVAQGAVTPEETGRTINAADGLESAQPGDMVVFGGAGCETAETEDVNG